MKNDEKALLWNVDQVAIALAISPWTVRSYIRQRKLQPVRVGRRVLFEPAECERFLQACKDRKSATPTQPLAHQGQRRNNASRWIR